MSGSGLASIFNICAGLPAPFVLHLLSGFRDFKKSLTLISRGGSRDDLRFSNTAGILPKKTMWFIGVEVEQETSAPLPKKNPGSAPDVFKSKMLDPIQYCWSNCEATMILIIIYWL